MKIIIGGGGKVGGVLVEKLSAEGHDLTLIDSDRQTLERSIENFDIMSYNGNCASYDVLIQAGVEEADLLIAAAASDEINLLSCFTAHSINPSIKTIARVRNPEYSTQAYTMRKQFGLSLTVNPERHAAAEMRRLLKYPGFLKRDTFAKGRAEIVELKIDEKSPLNNIVLKDLGSVIKCQALVCAVLRDGKAEAPNGNFRLQKDDRIYVSAPSKNMSVLLDNLGVVARKTKKVMIAGGSTISYYLAKLLELDGIEVTIIEKDEEKCQELSRLLPGATIINGDASAQDVLDSEGIRETDALVSLTGMDELNIIISIFGNICKVPQIITKVSQLNNNYVTEDLSIGSIITPKESVAYTIVRYVRAMSNQAGAAVSIHTIAEGQAEAIEFVVDANTLNAGVPLKNIRLRNGVLICGIINGVNTEIPNGDSVFNEGDSVIVVASVGTVLMQLNDIFIV
ncbi:MAG: Trk system potassium transporter TrkA [Lachnospiraceae bacterium]|nr:Trk system potassium transporter TrkA [Lachnospiraceae bacterium]